MTDLPAHRVPGLVEARRTKVAVARSMSQTLRAKSMSPKAAEVAHRKWSSPTAGPRHATPGSPSVSTPRSAVTAVATKRGRLRSSRDRREELILEEFAIRRVHSRRSEGAV